MNSLSLELDDSWGREEHLALPPCPFDWRVRLSSRGFELIGSDGVMLHVFKHRLEWGLDTAITVDGIPEVCEALARLRLCQLVANNEDEVCVSCFLYFIFSDQENLGGSGSLP
jgi:hypothetical protein